MQMSVLVLLPGIGLRSAIMLRHHCVDTVWNFIPPTAAHRHCSSRADSDIAVPDGDHPGDDQAEQAGEGGGEEEEGEARRADPAGQAPRQPPLPTRCAGLTSPGNYSWVLQAVTGIPEAGCQHRFNVCKHCPAM